MGKVHLRLVTDLYYDGVPDEHREACVSKLIELAEAKVHRADDDGMFTSDTIMELQKYDVQAEEVVPRTARDELIVDMARKEHAVDGQCEVYPDAAISDGDDNGAYVEAWVWVGFSGTSLDKEEE